MAALLMLGRTDEAGVAARNAYPRLLREGDEHRMLLSLSLLCAMQGRLESAARITGFADALQARVGENFGGFASLFRQRLDPLLAALPASERARLAAEGSVLRDEAVFRLALDEPG